MTHQMDDTTFASAGIVVENGLGGQARAFSLLMNEAMKLGRAGFLRADAFERSELANGFKGKTAHGRARELGILIYQARETLDGSTCCPASLERGRDNLGFGEQRLLYQNHLAAIMPDCTDYRWSSIKGRLRWHCAS